MRTPSPDDPDTNTTGSPEVDLLLRFIGDARGEAIITYVGARRARAARRGQRFLEGAGLTPAEALGAATQDEITEALLHRAAGAAAVSTDDRKVSALGRAFRVGLDADDDAEVDMAGLVIAALAELEPPDVRFLALMWRNRTERAESPNGWVLADEDLSSIGFSPVATSVVVSRLTRAGLIAEIALAAGGSDLARSGYGYPRGWGLTAFGHRIAEVLEGTTSGSVAE